MSQNDFILPVSFQAAQKIGLEESVLLAFLQQKMFLTSTSSLQIGLTELSSQLAFWTPQVLLRILSNLQAHQLLQFERSADSLIITLAAENIDQHVKNQPKKAIAEQAITTAKSGKKTNSDNELLHKVNRLQQVARQKTDQDPQYHTHVQIKANTSNDVDNVITPPMTEPTKHNRRGVSDFDLYLEQQERTRQPDQWQPETGTLEQINQAGIPHDFALQLQTEFLLRIKEQRKNVRTWNSEFFKYVKRQWQYKQTDRNSYEGASNSTYHSRTSKEQVSDALSNIHDTDW
ncbi:hypothetical protein CBF23_003055 [Marinomonas agarivorans]|nr:hypothetical protein CBF23_003055 [Marinomonas agarivorans]